VRRMSINQPDHAPASATLCASESPTPARQTARGLRRQLLRAERACRLCDVSLSTWWRWDAAGRIPAGIKISGGIKRWRREELIAWVRAGCPDRKIWNALRQQNG
jgi:predicted DNA-binding transcriptional regulator AlpA